MPFVVYVMARCKKFNINFVISPECEVIRGGEPCDGFFEAPEKGESGILVICIDKEINEVLHTLAHEYSHVLQWFEDDPLYLAWDKRTSEKHNYDLEVNAESRALALLKEWNLYNDEAQKRSAKYISELGGHDANVSV